MVHTSNPAGDDNRESATRTAVIAGGVDLLFGLAELLTSNSDVILADFLKTLLEFIAVLLAWLAIRRIQRGANHDFNYGVGKLENLSSLAVAILMVSCLVLITVDASRSILHPGDIAGLGVWICFCSQVFYGVINTRLCLKSRRMAREQNSPLMASQAGLFYTRVVGNLFIFISLAMSKLLHGLQWAHYIDPVASLIIAGSILFAALGIFKSSTLDLLDRTLKENSQIVILRALARHFDCYEELHEIRSRRSGSRVFVEIILGFSGAQSAAEVQATARRLKEELEREIPGSRVTVGIA